MKKYILGIVIVGIFIAILFYSIRPILVDRQTNQAIEELQDYLSNKYPGEPWNIMDADDFELKDSKIMFVIFNNGPKIVYEYDIRDKSVDQTGFWEKGTGNSLEEMLLEGLSPNHIE